MGPTYRIRHALLNVGTLLEGGGGHELYGRIWANSMNRTIQGMAFKEIL
jgi:hypothetical protein